MKRKASVFLSLVLSLILLSPAASAADTIKVGVIAPITGNLASIGNAVSEGIRLAFKIANAQGGVHGNKLELVVYDDRNVPEEAVSAAKRLISGDKVPVIIGSVGSSPTAAVQQITMREHVPLVTPVSMAPKLTEIGDKYIFRATATAAMRETTFAKFVAQRLKAKTVAFIASNEDLGRSTVEAAQKEYAKYGNPKPVYTAFFEPTATDFSAELVKIKALKPDVVYIVADSVRASIIVKQLRALNLQGYIVASAEAATNEFLRLAGPAAEGIYFPLDWSVDFDDAKSEEFLRLYKAEYKKLPETKFAVQGWEAAWLVIESLKNAKDYSPQAIRDALAKVAFDGPRGHLDFDDKGQVRIESRIAVVKNGRFVIAK
ncbi:MAG TPA: ABC transporter substrate-binding protein [Firmicutes bacterium]|nr:ABC transporter substrate-binding protein [Bacillota bacterium]